MCPAGDMITMMLFPSSLKGKVTSLIFELGRRESRRWDSRHQPTGHKSAREKEERSNKGRSLSAPGPNAPGAAGVVVVRKGTLLLSTYPSVLGTGHTKINKVSFHSLLRDEREETHKFYTKNSK